MSEYWLSRKSLISLEHVGKLFFSRVYGISFLVFCLWQSVFILFDQSDASERIIICLHTRKSCACVILGTYSDQLKDESHWIENKNELQCLDQFIKYQICFCIVRSISISVHCEIWSEADNSAYHSKETLNIEYPEQCQVSQSEKFQIVCAYYYYKAITIWK